MITARIIPLFLAMTLLLALPAYSQAAGKNIDSPAAQFVQKLGDKALTSLTAQGLPKGERSRRVRTLLRENFDITTIGRFVLGGHWREATDKQRAEYTKLFENMIVETYTRRFADYSGQSFKVLGAAPSSGGGDTIVKSQILQKDGPPVDVDWRVRDKGGMKIVDVLVDNISMSVTQRDDFDGVIQAGGGDIEALLSTLRKRQSGESNTSKQASKH
ncbi:MAG: ABC transporter substrate-binding protein [Alphaproteobacteria bacterium]|nr:MAG: ABC transporter substrate-binding protein [Alphaproteobacteria bacterium]